MKTLDFVLKALDVLLGAVDFLLHVLHLDLEVVYFAVELHQPVQAAGGRHQGDDQEGQNRRNGNDSLCVACDHRCRPRRSPMPFYTQRMGYAAFSASSNNARAVLAKTHMFSSRSGLPVSRVWERSTGPATPKQAWP